VVRITDPAGDERRDYGRLGEVVQSVRTLVKKHHRAPPSFTTRYRYDSWGRLLELTNPDQERILYGYDAGGLVDSVTGVGPRRNHVYVRRMEYDKFLQQTFVELGNGVQTTSEYRADDQRLARLASRNATGIFQDLRFDYDPVGNIHSLTNESIATAPSGRGGPVRQTFAYDELYRLVGASGSYAYAPDRRDEYTLSVSYDAANNIVQQRQAHDLVRPSGRRVRQSESSFADDYVYSATQPHAAVRVGDRRFTYDANGNETAAKDGKHDTRRKLEWNEEDRLRSIDGHGDDMRFVYDAAGRRVIERRDDDERVLVTPYFTIEDGDEITSHIVVGDSRVASRFSEVDDDEEEVVFYHPDQLGSVQYVTNRRGKVTQHFEYFPFGRTWVDERRDDDGVPATFAGQPLDRKSGLIHFPARDYDPRLGRFLSVDPTTADDGAPEDSPTSLSPYTYASGNPVRLTAPGGRAASWWSRLALTFALLGGVGGPGSADPNPVPDLFRSSDSPSSGAVSGPSGGIVGGAGAGVIHDVPRPAREFKLPTRERSNAISERPADLVIGRDRSNAVIRRAGAVLGENMAGRVNPYARSVGAETIVDWLNGREWTQQLNDDYVRSVRADHLEAIDIGPDFGRRLQFHLNPPKDRFGRPVYESERELLRGYENRRQVFVRNGKFSGGVPGFDKIAKPEGDVEGIPP
jgi:RHS repeat-associated protein